MQNVPQEAAPSNQSNERTTNVQQQQQQQRDDLRTSKSAQQGKPDSFSDRRRYMSDTSESEDDCLSGVEPFMIDQDFEEDPAAKFLLNPDEDRSEIHPVDPETQARLEALLQAADEAAAALTRMRTDQGAAGGGGGATGGAKAPDKTSLVEACTDGDVHTVQKLLTEGGRSVHETSEEGESLLSLACSAGYFELAQVLLAMHANVEDRGIKGECTPLMEAASAGHLDIVRLLVVHGADVNAQSTTGNTPLMYGCAGGHTEVVQFLLEHGANVEDHNENGHTPLMEAASAGHVGLAKILLMHGAGINTHSNEFKESALTLACYKGHLDMVRFLLEAGADQEHKTDEMHTALMEASMDGHVEVARLLLDSGAQVNMPTDSFESPLTLAACGGHVDLAMLLIERGANIEEVNDEGYTPLMEAAREGHEEMVHLLLGQGANINAQTDETQETALTLACCGGFADVTDILLKGGANIELGASTPLMEAAQEGHLDLVKFLLQSGANVHAQTQTGDTALTYACENGHTDVADLLLQYGANLEHESEGGRTPLMKACRAGHLCTVQFLISKGANVKKQTTNNDHTPLSLACAGGHMSVVELLLAQNADPNHKLKDNSTMLIEAAKGGHTNVVQLLLDFPHSIQSLVINQYQQGAAPPSALSVLPNQNLPQPINFFSQSPGAVLQEVPEAIRIVPQDELNNFSEINKQQLVPANRNSDPLPLAGKKSLLPKSQSTGNLFESTLTSAEAQQVRTQPLPLDFEEDILSSTTMEFLHKEDQNSTLIDYIKNRKKHYNVVDDGTSQKQQILEELHKVERELHGKQHSQSSVLQYPISQEQCPTVLANALPNMLSMDLTMQQQQGLGAGVSNAGFHAHNLQLHNAFYAGNASCVQSPTLKLAIGDDAQQQQQQPAFYFTPLTTSVTVSLTGAAATTTTSVAPSANQVVKFGGGGSLHDQYAAAGTAIDDSMIASLTAQSQELSAQDLSRVEYFTVPAAAAQLPMHTIYPYEYLDATAVPGKDQSGAIYQAGFQAGINLMQQQLAACPTATTTAENLVEPKSPPLQQQPPQQPAFAQPPKQQQTQCNRISTTQFQTNHHCQHQQPVGSAQPQPIGQVQVATQTQSQASDAKKQPKAGGDAKPKKNRVVRPQAQNQNFQHNHNFQIDPNSAITQYTNGVVNQPCPNSAPLGMDVDSETESNHDTALTLACAGGHEELVELLLNRGADIEHRDKKGFTPLILAATAGHDKVVEILLNHNADIEAQSERTKDTPLSLACSGGRYEVVEILLKRNANKEHRNVSDYTPLSLAASGGYVNIIKLLLSHGAEINSRTGSKLGISPLMLAAMNGHTAAVKLLLDMGSDINAQIETNRNTALTLACFQGRHEVVSLLLDRKANVEHRAKTGLTPLMEAASGGYVDVGRVLLDKGADVNAPPVPSSRDTALTIAADKGHVRFVELLLHRGAMVEVKNKKGNSPMWLAANGGHLAVVELLYNVNADIDSQDNRKVSCLMAAFRKGHHKVVKWMVHSVTQFPSDQEMVRYISTVNDKDLAEKCQECAKIIRAAKETQALKANQNASILLEELDKEKNREETKRMAAARRRERKKKKKIEKKEERRKLLEENKKNENYDETVTAKITESEEKPEENSVDASSLRNVVENGDKEEGDSGIDANSQGSCSSSELKAKDKRKDKKKKKSSTNLKANASRASKGYQAGETSKSAEPARKTHETKSPAERDDFEATGNDTYVPPAKKKEAEPVAARGGGGASPKQACKREEGWKEVVRKSSVQAVSSEPGSKKVSVPLNAISRVIGRGGSNINAIRGATGAHIEVEKQCKGQGERIITIKGTAESTKQAHSLIATLIKDPDADILQMLPKTIKPSSTTTTLWDKTQLGTKKVTGKVTSSTYVSSQNKDKAPSSTATSAAAPAAKQAASTAKAAKGAAANRAPRLAASAPASQGRGGARANVKYAASIPSQSFASKLATEPVAPAAPSAPKPKAAPPAEPLDAHDEPAFAPRLSAPHASPVKQARPEPTTSAPPNLQTFQSPRRTPLVPAPNAQTVNANAMSSEAPAMVRSQTPNVKHPSHQQQQPSDEQQHNMAAAAGSSSMPNHLEYSLFNSAEQPMWRRNNEHEAAQKPINFAAVTGGAGAQPNHPPPKFIEDHSPPQVDASKAPGYRGGGGGGGAICSPISSKSSATSPNVAAPQHSVAYHEAKAPPHMVSAMMRPPPPQPEQPTCDLSSGSNFYNDIFKQSTSSILNMGKETNPMMSTSYGQQPARSSFSQTAQPPVLSMSRLNPKAPDFSSSMYGPAPKMPGHYNGYAPADAPMFCGGNGKLDAGFRQSQIPLMQLHQPLTQQQTEMISGMTVGLTLQNLARVTGGEILEANGPADGLAAMMGQSPSMSPSLGLGQSEKMYDERKMLQPQPIGTERANRSKYYQPSLDNSWIVANENKMRWSGAGLDRVSLNRMVDQSNVYKEPQLLDSFKHGLQLDGPHAFPNNAGLPPFMQIGGVRQPDFVPNVVWDTNSTQNFMGDKHVWPMKDWKE